MNDEGAMQCSGKLSGKLFILDAFEIDRSPHVADSAVKEISENFWH